MKKPNKKLVSQYYPFLVAGCLIEKDNKILLVKEGMVERGKWNQPAGWIDKNENPIKAAQREAEEETGLKIKIKNFLGIYSFTKRKQVLWSGDGPMDVHAVKLIFLAKVIGGKIKFDNKEIIDAKFFKPEEIFKLRKKDLRDYDIIDEVKDYLAGKKYPINIIKHIKFTAKY
jgi:ADP-ribose pyrophosphatase YjhB (NUDIX family)